MDKLGDKKLTIANIYRGSRTLLLLITLSLHSMS